MILLLSTIYMNFNMKTVYLLREKLKDSLQWRPPITLRYLRLPNCDALILSSRRNPLCTILKSQVYSNKKGLYFYLSTEKMNIRITRRSGPLKIDLEKNIPR